MIFLSDVRQLFLLYLSILSHFTSSNILLWYRKQVVNSCWKSPELFGLRLYIELMADISTLKAQVLFEISSKDIPGSINDQLYCSVENHVHSHPGIFRIFVQNNSFEIPNSKASESTWQSVRSYILCWYTPDSCRMKTSSEPAIDFLQNPISWPASK